LYFDQNTVYDAFSAFIAVKNAELQSLRNTVGLTSNDLFDAVHQMMQGQVSTWTEEQVEEKLDELCIEFRTVAVLNEAMNLQRKSIKNLSDDIANAFAHMKVPGSVVEKLNYPWVSTLKAMRVISVTQWAKIDRADRESYTELFRQDAKKVWGFVTSQKPLLEEYMEEHGHNCSNEELDSIYSALKTAAYDSLPADFDAKIEIQLQNVAYTRNKTRIQELWVEQSGFNTVAEWCGNFAVPIQWVVKDDAMQHIAVLKSIQDGKRVDNLSLHNATQFFETHTIVELKDKAAITSSFIAQIGESYRAAFEAAGNVLVSRLKTNPKLTSDVYSWSNKVGEIRKIVDAFLRDKYCVEAKKKVKTMPEAQLRDRVVQLLDENPDLYAIFMK
jgi:hypothetical protein